MADHGTNVDASVAPPSPAELSSWQALVLEGQQCWEVGNNARLREILAELVRAPGEEPDIHEFRRSMQRRLAPDPLAIVLWLLTVLVFCYLVFRFVL